MALTGQNITVYQGNTHSMTIVVEDNGLPVDLTDYSATWVVYDQTTKQLILIKTTESGGGITKPIPANGELIISIVPSDTDSVTPKVYSQQCDIQLDENTVYTVSTGSFTVLYSKI